MCNWIAGVVVLGSLLGSHTLAQAGNKHNVIIEGGIVHLKGALTAATCVVANESRNLTVDMGQIRSNQFNGTGSYAPAVPFYIHLTECNTTANRHVGMTFWGATDNRDPQIIKVTDSVNAAQGVGVAIFDNSGNALVPNTETARWIPIFDGDNRLQFLARYRATQPEVTGGQADVTAWFTLTYP